MVAQRLKELRIKHKLTQLEVASLLNISREAYSMYENEKRQLNNDALCIIADYYQVSIDYLFGRTDMPEPYGALSREETALLFQYRALDVRGQQNVLDITRLEYERGEKEKILQDRQYNLS